MKDYSLKNKDYFSKNKVQIAAQHKEYRSKHKEQIATWRKDHYFKHKEQIVAHNKNYRFENKEKIAIYMKDYYLKNKKRWKDSRLKNKERIAAYMKDYGTKNKERLKGYDRDYTKEKIKTDIQFRLGCLLRNRLGRAIKRGSRSGSAVRDLGCTIPELKFYLEGQFQDGMNWDNWSLRGWHIDHKIPLAFFDLTDREQFLQAVHYTNLQPMWAKKNLSKGKKVVNCTVIT